MSLIDDITKNEIIQESGLFNDPKARPTKCRVLLAQMLSMVNRGNEEFSENEGTDIFFSITRIFQSTNLPLKKMIYMTIREMVNEPSFYIITSSLLRDMKDKNDFIKMNALKVLPYVISSNNPAQSEQLIKTAIFNKNISVVNSALLASYKISIEHEEHIRRCANDIQNILFSKPGTCHYHALNVLYNIKKNDMMSFIKILLQLTKSSKTFNVLTTIQLIRYVREVIESDILDSNTEKELYLWLAKQLNKSNTVVIEVARTMVMMKNISNSEMTAVVTSLGLYIISSTNVYVYATLKILYEMIKNPVRIPLINNTGEIELLLANDNKGIRALAMCILLKVSKKDKLKGLLDKVYMLFEDIPDSIKIEILDSCKDLMKKYPQKATDILGFLWRCLRERGEYEFKNEVIEAMDQIINSTKSHQTLVYEFLCEYIEDPFSPELVLKILDKLKNYVSKIHNPSRYLRYILNRLHLDDAAIRAASISCLGEMAMKVDSLKEEVISILKSFLNDLDSEVRDRAYYYHKILNGDEEFEEMHHDDCFDILDLNSIQQMVNGRLDNLDDFDITDIVRIPEKMGTSKATKLISKTEKQIDQAIHAIEHDENAVVQDLATEIGDIFDKEMFEFFSGDELFEDLGELKISSEFSDLVEKDSEYYTKVRKHVFEDFIVLEYKIQNNDDEHNLTEVEISDFESNSEDLQIYNMMENEEIKVGETGTAFVTLAKNPESKISPATLNGILKFTAVAKDDDGNVENEYEDEYNLEEFNVGVHDFLSKYPLYKGQFKKDWDGLMEDFEEKIQSYKLEYKTVEVAVTALVKHFGISVCDSSDALISNDNFHTLYLSGNYLGENRIMIACQIGMDAKFGCVVKLRVKCEDSEISDAILETLE